MKLFSGGAEIFRKGLRIFFGKGCYFVRVVEVISVMVKIFLCERD